MFGPKYTILELDSIPREKSILQATIFDARQRQKRSNLTRFAALNMFVWALFILFVWTPMQGVSAAAATHPYSIYMLVVGAP